MRINSIGVQYSQTFNGKQKKTVIKGGNSVADLAKQELAKIEAKGKKAGTSHAWWRQGFEEAMSDLESIAKGETPESSTKSTTSSSLLRFHDTEEDGFI